MEGIVHVGGDQSQVDIEGKEAPCQAENPTVTNQLIFYLD